MLLLKQIYKDYPAGDTKVEALRGIDIEFRKSEFVSILGPSGCGKTTLLNIIGGLDQYTSGDLVIGEKSTKNFTDTDWDAYRNHSIGFVFQSYNLIPHQSVLANVELALTISGVSKAERRRRAEEALCRVGLAGEIAKKPNQLSGGQMQRVAIARALVNNPEILLADEPTGALDSETSVQIMELLREVARDRLVIMVTHNPELAERYSTRIIRILDGKIIGDTNPYHTEKNTTENGSIPAKKKAKTCNSKEKRLRNRSMSFFTALSLSLNNLKTKKGRTFLTSFAGSIGIIGIALILAVSQGVQGYINRVQEDTLSSYPITIQAESVDMSSLIATMMNAGRDENAPTHELDAVYANKIMYELMSSLSSTDVQKNNLTAFKTYLENTPAFREYGTIQYSYGGNFNIYTKNQDGTIIKSDLMELMEALYGMNAGEMPMASSFASYNVWQELLPGGDGQLISELLDEQYDVIYGNWPAAYNEIVLVVDENNEISDLALYALGLKTTEQVKKELIDSMNGITDPNTESWSYEELMGMTFKLILSPDFYQKNKDGTYTDLSQNETGLSFLYNSDKSIELKISGIVRPSKEAVSSMISGTIGYTSALTEYAIQKALESDIVKEQLASPTIDVINGLPFQSENDENLSDAEKAALIRAYFASLSAAEKASIYTAIKSQMSEEALEAETTKQLAQYTRDQLAEMAVKAYAEQMGVTDTTEIEAYINGMTDEELYAAIFDHVKTMIADAYAKQIEQALGAYSVDELAHMLDTDTSFTEADYARFFDDYMPATTSDSTYEANLKLLGYIDMGSPVAIQIYASSFENKDMIADLIADYNAGVGEADQISYTDYVRLLMSSITTIINAISYVLIAFVAISLVVSSIMIGIITYISVLERTKEIGILRAIGASKRDISRVFNAETATVGFISGVLGIGITLLLTIPINLILHSLTGIQALSASLPVIGSLILVAISIALTLIAGLIPSRIAAKKDPVVALRTE